MPHVPRCTCSQELPGITCLHPPRDGRCGVIQRWDRLVSRCGTSRIWKIFPSARNKVRNETHGCAKESPFCRPGAAGTAVATASSGARASRWLGIIRALKRKRIARGSISLATRLPLQHLTGFRMTDVFTARPDDADVAPTHDRRTSSCRPRPASNANQAGDLE